jgi:thiamine transport system substrate-binding protein
MRTTRVIAIATVIAATAATASCSEPAPAASSGSPQAPTTVTVLTHDSFAMDEGVVAAFEASSGIDVEFVTSGDGGSLANQIILTKDAPLADVVYGIDNTFASRVVEQGVLTGFSSTAPATQSDVYRDLPEMAGLTAIDYSDVCINVDLTYFAAHGLTPPTTLDDLADPAYADLLVVTNPAASSPGLAFLLATVAAYGDDWQQYWTALKANGVRVAGSWSDAYFVDFSAPNYGGDRPIVLSYASSPPSEVIDGEPTTAALLDTCFRQVEYAGVLEGARQPEAAKQVIDWMLSDDFQSALPHAMYVYPVSQTATIPAEWLEFAPLSPEPWSLSPAEIDDRREELVLEWTSVVLD